MRTLSLTAGLILLAGLLVAGIGCLPDTPGLEPDDKPAGKPADKPADQPAGGGTWGGIKGQVVFTGASVPERLKADVNKDQNHCLSKGPILDEKWVVNPKNKGVKWAVVWLTSDNNVRVAGKMPIHPNLEKSKNAEAYVDQPCCVYEPHVLAMRSDQTLVFKNSGAVPHNVKYEALAPNPSGNPIINPGASEKAGAVSYAWTPITLECSIHGWMKSYVRVFDHPYFCVTDDDGNFEIKDAPAGDWYLNVWHEDVGIKGAGKTTVVDGKKVTPAGQKVTIKAGETTKVEPIGLDKP